MEWIDHVESIVGHDLDEGDVGRDVQSPLDKAYDAYEAGFSPAAYVEHTSIQGVNAAE